MNKHFPVWILALLVLLIFGFNLFATYWHLYFLIWWLDIPVHMFGGACIALIALSFYFRPTSLGFQKYSSLSMFVYAITATLILGLGWEVYEFVFDRAMSVNDLQLGDTIKDICDDLFGAGVATLLFIKKGYNKNI